MDIAQMNVTNSAINILDPIVSPANNMTIPCYGENNSRNCYLINLTTKTLMNTVGNGWHDSVEALSTTPGRILVGFGLFLIIVLTVFGNILVLCAVILHRKLRTVSNMFIASLSMADLLVGTIVMIPGTFNEIFHEWILPHSFCSIWASFDVMLCSASILNVCLISLDRYLAIMTPLRYNVVMTHRRALLLLAVAWGIAVLTSFVPIETGLHNPAVPSLENLTLLSDRPQCVFIVSPFYAITVSTVTIFLPIIIALVLYYRVSKEANRQACFVGSLTAPGTVLLGKRMASKHIREPFTRKATITLGIIVGAYVVTWAPFFVTNTVDSFCQCIPPEVFAAFVWLGWCNSLINPIIYPLFMRDFRKVYLLGLIKCCPQLRLAKGVRPKKELYKDSSFT